MSNVSVLVQRAVDMMRDAPQKRDSPMAPRRVQASMMARIAQTPRRAMRDVLTEDRRD